MRLNYRTMNRHFMLFFWWISKHAYFWREYGTRRMVRLLWWHNSCMTKSRIALSSSKRAFPGVCACREQQSPSNVITGMAKWVTSCFLPSAKAHPHYPALVVGAAGHKAQQLAEGFYCG